MFSKEQAIHQMNEWAKDSCPFLFILDFDGNKNLLYPLDQVPESILYDVNGMNNGRKEVKRGTIYLNMNLFPSRLIKSHMIM